MATLTTEPKMSELLDLDRSNAEHDRASRYYLQQDIARFDASPKARVVDDLVSGRIAQAANEEVQRIDQKAADTSAFLTALFKSLADGTTSTFLGYATSETMQETTATTEATAEEPQTPFVEQAEQATLRLPTPPASIEKTQNRSSWRERSPRLARVARSLAAVAVMATILLPTMLTSSNAKSTATKAPAVASSSPNQTPDLIKPSFPFTTPSTLPSAEVAPQPTQTVEAPKTETPKPKIDPNSDKSLWGVFANTYGSKNANAKIVEYSSKLEAMGFKVIYRGEPNKDRTWWITIIIGPDGQRYAGTHSIASLMATV